MWRDNCEQFEEDMPAIDVVVEQVWKPTLERYEDFVHKLKTGEIEFKLVEQLIGKKCGKDTKLLHDELKYLGLEERMINERIIQIEKHGQVKHCVYFAKVIIALQEAFDLQGNFQPIRKITEHNLKATRINDFDEQLVEACAILHQVTAEQSFCMENYLRSKDLVSWIRNSTKESGPKELKVFIELALITAGENQMNVKKVQCLQDAVDGYASLIFDLKTNDGYTELLEKCALVWKILKQRPELPEKILDSNRQGRKSDKEGIVEIMREIARFLESCLEDWQKHIKDRRNEFPLLNFFTTDQLVFLQKELIKFETNADPSVFVYPVLSVLKEHCTKDDIIDSMTKAKRKVLEIAEEQKAEKERLLANKSQSEIDAQKRLEFLKKLDEMCIEVDLAERSLAHVSNEDIVNADITNAMMWCMEERERITDFQKGNDTGSLKTTFLHSGSSLMASINEKLSHARDKRETGSAPLINSLEDLWTHFLGSISSSIKDFLSLDHLGIVLKNLQIKDERNVRRSFTPNLREGEPNLFVCQEDEVLQTCLSLYKHNDDQPLPLSDEVLQCSSQTSTDEMDIFLRRVFSGDDQKIHCLVNVEKLNYDVAELAEQYVEKHLDEQGREDKGFYKFVVICASGSEYRSNLVSSLGKYTRTRDAVDISSLQDYLLTKLENDELQDFDPAAALHRHRSTVWVVKSTRAGMGKSLYAERLTSQLATLKKRSDTDSRRITIPLQEKAVNSFAISEQLLQNTTCPERSTTNIFHLDVYPESSNTELPNKSERLSMAPFSERSIFDRIVAISTQSIGFGWECYQQSDLLFDKEKFHSEVFQRPYRYLSKLDNKENIAFGGGCSIMATGLYEDTCKERQKCLETLIRHCGVENPSWAELHNFVWFLNTQLVDLENNQFTSASASSDLPGFGQFALRFMVHMSRDFSTRSLKISEAVEEEDNRSESDYVDAFKMRRTWESSPHPYIFINSDRMSFTFLGFSINRRTYDLENIKTGCTIEGGSKIITRQLYDALMRNGVQLHDKFDSLNRSEKLMRLCFVMGVNVPFINGKPTPNDPDVTYELTTDNVKKMLAIYMRFRCNIPVIVMGETGCGKTRLIEFLCKLQRPLDSVIQNMIIIKIHGGTTAGAIAKKVEFAQKIAQANLTKYGQQMYTVMFFDEANTTEAIGVIKEIMCDRAIAGNKLVDCPNLKFVAACNPYRKHSEDLIEKLEKAGLGYHVDAEKTTDKLGTIPMRKLVYRVQPLPRSLLPFVWDFGQLDSVDEETYIRQMILHRLSSENIPLQKRDVAIIGRILSACQQYMRQQEDECSFVSLRDVERTLKVMAWFYETGPKCLFRMMNEHIESQQSPNEVLRPLSDMTRSLVLAIGVCYHACLTSRATFRSSIAHCFKDTFALSNDAGTIKAEIDACQFVFADNIEVADNIAKNTALKENFFMMVVCTELRIPLFIVGKPGSSKSLARIIVDDAMQGDSSKCCLFKIMKKVQMISFQCSPHSTAEGIVGVFRQCAYLQRNKDTGIFVATVVLDEIGLAEDSPRMPLKTLHALLEEGCEDEDISPHERKVGFIGISNWALDPAKMNRGLLVQRAVPDIVELKATARGICMNNEETEQLLLPIVEPLAESYLVVFQRASECLREFFGLRDFYSLIKMVNSFVEKTKKRPTWPQLLYCIKRNFGGLDRFDPVEPFQKRIAHVTFISYHKDESGEEVDNTAAGLIRACLFGDERVKVDSRYLLLLTENFGALTIIQQQLFSDKTGKERPEIIFGSSFKSDQKYTQVCRNINKIKVCMETGKTVILLNLENLYESLYDALNQYYVRFGGERFVDIGLGTHRVKCPVHIKFRLIVVAETKTVYKTFPIPLINRLEKHFLSYNTMLTDKQRKIVVQLNDWARDFVTEDRQSKGKIPEKKNLGDVFIGFHPDTCSAITLDLCGRFQHEQEYQLLERGKRILLWCAIPESLVRRPEIEVEVYNIEQQHESLEDYLEINVKKGNDAPLLAQITTHSKLLAGVHKPLLSSSSGIPIENILLLESLPAFDTEQQFSSRIKQHMVQNVDGNQGMIVIQCDSGDQNETLIASARYCILAAMKSMTNVHVVFIVQLPRKSGGCFGGFQSGIWHSAHIDELYCEEQTNLYLREMQGKTLSEIFRIGLGRSTTLASVERTIPVEKIRQILIACVHSSLSVVKDVTGNRETERLDIVLKCLRRNEICGQERYIFVDGLIGIVSKRLKYLERDPIKAKRWTTYDSAQTKSISKAGTFRRACLQTLMEKVSPIVAHSIAFLDTDKQLDLLYDGEDWKQMLWLRVLNTADALNIQIVCECIEEKACQLVSKTGNKGLITEVLISVHLALREIDEHLANFRSINALWPKCGSFLQSFKQDKTFSKSADGYLLHALHGLIDTLKPSVADISNKEAMWLTSVHQARPVVEMTFSHIYKTIQLDIQENTDLLRNSSKGNCCCKCERKIKEPPVEFPCKHLLCDECYETKFLLLEQRTCLGCREVVQNEWQPDKSAENWTAKIKFNRYQQCCNAFYMGLVSQICFDDQGPPSDEVIDRLLSYTFSTSDDKKHFTRDITIFDTGVDPNPVFRTYLLQMLIRSSCGTFYRLSNKFFDKAKACIQKSDGWNESLVEIFSLVCQCIEDELYQNTRTENILQSCFKALDLAQGMFEADAASIIAKLIAVANMKFLLKHITVVLATSCRTREGNPVDEGEANLLRMTRHMLKRPEAVLPR
ncbi:E3 ubiquitin-protein ligase rnf213-alpha-like [Mya arenaria]|uniref:E3 ubiquitin-protein ligase rnf213-alpha-like n=1 Tax=Mya arenaria TaxID=6604 RepID=UPI0022E98A41|nr:E3 ubiquitin-protein ligase rnf213-alpha-like [Mya arenaria]